MINFFDDKSRNVKLFGEVNKDMFEDLINNVNDIIKEINEHEILNLKDITLNVLINSEGGDVSNGLGIYDFLIYLKTIFKNVNTCIFGAAYSMGFIIALAGDKRIISKNSVMMIHGTSGYSEGSIINRKKILQTEEKIQNILLSLILEKNKNLKKQIIDLFNTNLDLYITPKEALKMKIVTEII